MKIVVVDYLDLIVIVIFYFFISIVKLWNELLRDVVEIDNFQYFKVKFKLNEGYIDRLVRLMLVYVCEYIIFF